MNLLIHLENADRVGILPSQLDDVRIMAKGLGIERLSYIDLTTDGHLFSPEWERYRTLDDWLKQVNEPMIIFETENVPKNAGIKSVSANKLTPKKDSWLMFGPSSGFSPVQVKQYNADWCFILPNLVLNSRDAVPIGLWIMTRIHG